MKIRSLLLGSVAAAGLSTGAFSTDLGIETDISIGDDNFGNFLRGVGIHPFAMTPDGHFGVDLGGHLSAANDYGETVGPAACLDEGADECFLGLDMAPANHGPS